MKILLVRITLATFAIAVLCASAAQAQNGYTPPSITFSPSNVILLDTVVGTQECSKVTLDLKSIGDVSSAMVLDSILDNSSFFKVSTVPSLPAELKAGDSVIFDVCYTPQDTNLFIDSINVIIAGCIDTAIFFQAQGLTPLIYATDLDFGEVDSGQTKCLALTVRNPGKAPLIISNAILPDTTDFSFLDANVLPFSLAPGRSIQLIICFHPRKAGAIQTTMRWGTNLEAPFTHSIKDTSLLSGNGFASNVNPLPQSVPFSLSISPNPASGAATISLTGAPSANVEIFDVLGREVANFRVAGNYEWQMGTLPAGTYIVRAGAGGTIVSRRVVKE
ncbi:MAG: choice-of-anchor D domain-containing protein [Candidatus Kapaibacterium sp.]